MKKLISIALVFCSLFVFFGCNSTSTESKTVSFYYVLNKPSYGTAAGMIEANNIEVRNSNSYRMLLEKYFNGPTNYECVSPFPAGITLEDFQISGDKAQLLLSPHMAILTGAEMTVALACLTRTVIEMTGVNAVQIQIQNNTINGQESVLLTMNNFSYTDEVS